VEETAAITKPIARRIETDEGSYYHAWLHRRPIGGDQDIPGCPLERLARTPGPEFERPAFPDDDRKRDLRTAPDTCGHPASQVGFAPDRPVETDEAAL